MAISIISLLPEQFLPTLLIASIFWLILEYLSIARRIINLVLSIALTFAITLFFSQAITIASYITTLFGTNGSIILIPIIFIFGSILGIRRRHRKMYYTSAGPVALTKLEKQKESLLLQLRRVAGDEKKEKKIVEAIDRLDKQILSLRKRLR